MPLWAEDELLKRTISRCPICFASCPAEVWRTRGPISKVLLKRSCSVHGEASVCIASDARFYWLAKGNPENACGCGPECCSADGSSAGTLGRNAAPGDALGVAERLSTPTIEFGLRWPNIRGISFQPLFLSGRLPPGQARLDVRQATTERINPADIIVSP